MPLSIDNIIQTKTGSFEDSGTVSFDTATTAGSCIIICCVTRDGQLGFPNGDGSFTRKSDSPAAGTPSLDPVVYVKANSAGGETSWTLATDVGNGLVCWVAVELPGVGVDPNTEFTMRSSIVSTGAGTQSTETTRSLAQTTSSYDTMSFALFAGSLDSSTIPTWSGYTNNFQELAEVGAVNGATNRSLDLAVATMSSQALGQFECTATVSPDAIANATIVTFYADGGKRFPDIHAMSGFEFGRAAEMTAGSEQLSCTPWDTAVGSPAIVTTSPRTGSYCLELSSSAAAECVTWVRVDATRNPNLSQFSPSINFPWVGRFHIYFPTSLPSADVELASIEAGSLTNGVTVWFRNASSKIGVKVGTGTEVLSDATVAADKWIGIDYRYDARTTTHTCDWQVDYDSLDTSAAPVAQTSASNTGMTAANIEIVRYGWSTAKTATVRYDDIAGSKIWGAYPIGDIRIGVLKPAGTATVSGTSTNFEVYTSNGTGSAFTSAGAIAAVDDVPPTLGASADGIMQVSVATNDYVEFPLDTFTAAPTNVLRAARIYLAGWAASGNPATIGARYFDGTTETTIANVVDHGFSNATAAQWLTKQVRTANDFYLLTQAKLDALAVRVGWAGDATPDVGFHSIFAEIAYSPAAVIQVSSAEDNAFKLWVRQDAISGGVASYLLDTLAATRGATISWTINSVDGSQHIGPSATYEKAVGVDETVQFVGMTPDP